MKGFINLIKPSGMSSAYAVGAVKKKFNTPCGHMGTLDPMASGVLPVGIGKASRLFQYLLLYVFCANQRTSKTVRRGYE